LRKRLLRSFTDARSFSAVAISTFVGCALVLLPAAATQPWLDRHFLPSFFLPRESYVRLETIVRSILAACGVALILASGRVGRLLGRAPGVTVSIVAAGVLALGTSEVVLRRVHLRPAEWLLPEEEPRRQPDPRLGWVLQPARTGRAVVGGRTIEYAIDPAGYRVRRVEEAIDPARPTILFTGESVMFGEGLAWDETVPATVGALLGVQTANLAVHGYSNDQTYLRLERELPRFRHPLAVVTLFMTTLFGRNLDDDRPHLGPGLVWLPAESTAKLASLAALLVPYRASTTVDRGIRMCREVLRATVDLARTRNAAMLIVVPQIGRESDSERLLREEILDPGALPYVQIEIDPAWHVPWDRHPDARADRLIAQAVAARLRSALDRFREDVDRRHVDPAARTVTATR
jgi:hypothetical protein